MIRTHRRSPGKAIARFVRKSHVGPGYEWCEQSAADPRYDIATGTCDAEDLPDEVRAACDAYYGAFYACGWPGNDQQAGGV
jgi:hypothetical protein